MALVRIATFLQILSYQQTELFPQSVLLYIEIDLCELIPS